MALALHEVAEVQSRPEVIRLAVVDTNVLVSGVATRDAISPTETDRTTPWSAAS